MLGETYFLLSRKKTLKKDYVVSLFYLSLLFAYSFHTKVFQVGNLDQEVTAKMKTI